MIKKLLPFALFFGLISTFLFSCKKDEFETSGNVQLTFSEDTIMFDTVFTSVGSATEVFTVYNTEDKAILISSLRLANGQASDFRLNVDGMPGKAFTDVEIGANDSIFIFVEVTVDPNNQNTPLVITDSIIFETNGNIQDLDLVAWGQDAYFHRPNPNSRSFPLFALNCNEVWNNDKPHVIYGYAAVDSGCTLTINAGTQVHLHPGSILLVLEDASLYVNGTVTEKVVIQGDRLHSDYADVPGQWDRIYIAPGSKNSYIKNAIIKNGSIGLQVDSFATPSDSCLYLENTIVKNMSNYALLLQGSIVSAYNCVFANCGGSVLNIRFGGNYKFYQSTFANFWDNGTRQDPVIFMNNYYTAVRPLNSYFGNCIVYGNNDQEIGLDSLPMSNQFNFYFDNALLKVENDFSTSSSFHYNGIVRATSNFNNPGFADIGNNIYKLDSINSSALEKGSMSVVNAFPSVLNFDLEGNARPQRLLPDLGAYERQ